MPARPHRNRRALFAEEYAKDFNAIGAAIRAGYSPKTAKHNCAVLLRDPQIQGLIRAVLDRDRKHISVDRMAVVGELAAIGFANMQDFVSFLPPTDTRPATPYFDWQKMGRHHWAAIKKLRTTHHKDGSMSIEAELHGKVPALVKLGEHLGIFEVLPGSPVGTGAKVDKEQLRDEILRLVDGQAKRLNLPQIQDDVIDVTTEGKP